MKSDTINSVVKTLNKTTSHSVNARVYDKYSFSVRHVFISELSEIKNSKFLSRQLFVKTC